MNAIMMAVAILLVATGCSSEPEMKAPVANEAAPPAAKIELPEGAQAFGEIVTVETPVKLAAVRSDPDSYFEKTILVEATASAVCQSKGCWLTMADGESEPIWVRWSSGCGGKYAFPKDVAGKRILVQGSFYEKEIETEEAAHLAEESEGLEADEIAGKTYEMNATACIVLPKKQTS